ncbi:hypothetical protein V5799_009992 [Amblyomma americanum]|uniref:GH18 domain-containing protein n=1 Tax=Amblyomma americanum TaxID=6943 RepID=A0AAQ4F8X0_AMBAM
MGLRTRLGSLLVLLGLFAASCSQTTLSDGAEGKSVVCYWQSWSHKRPSPYTYDIDDIPVHICTHVIYSYAKLDTRSNSLYLDKEFDSERDGYFRFLDMKKRNPQVKLLLALGDRNGSDSAEWHQALLQPTKRFHVVGMLYKLLSHNRFDGVHLNWEIPMESASAKSPSDRQLVTFVSHIRRTFKWPNFLVSCVVALPRLDEKLSAGLRGLLPYVDLFHASAWTASDVKINSTMPAISRAASGGQSGPLSDAAIVSVITVFFV